MIGVRHRNGRVIHGVGLQRAPGKNYLLYSQTLANSAWTKYGSAVVGAKVLAPDGTMTADSVTGAAAAYVRQKIPSAYYVVGTPFVASVWYRVPTGTASLYLEIYDGYDGNPYYQTACNVTTGWKRFVLSGTIGAGIDYDALGFYLGSRFGTFPTDKAVEMWGAQLVLGTTTLRKYVATEGTVLK